jgi:Dual specificity phosphatase, catalytic domain
VYKQGGCGCLQSRSLSELSKDHVGDSSYAVDDIPGKSDSDTGAEPHGDTMKKGWEIDVKSDRPTGIKNMKATLLAVIVMAVFISLVMTACAPVIGTVKNFIGVPSIVEVAPGLFVGNRVDAHNVPELQKFGINAILNVAAEVNDPTIPGMIQKKIGMRERNDLTTHFQLEMALETLQVWLAAGHKVLLHCYLGENRSVWVAAHYLARQEHKTWRKEFAKIKKTRKEAYIKGWMF